MGQYNPHRPSILGQEWAPARESPYLLDTETERGVTFVLDHAATVVSGAVYLDDVPANVSSKGVVMALYEAGTEHLTGPIQRVVVPPVSGFWRSTDSLNPSDVETDPNNITIAQALERTNDGAFVSIREDTEFYVMFDTSTVSSQLSGKRILGLNILYVMTGTQTGVPGPLPDSPVTHHLYLQRGNPDTGDQRFADQGTPTVGLNSTTVPEISRAPIGNMMIFDIDTLCTTTNPPAQGGSIWPIRPDDLSRFDTGTAVGVRLTAEFTQSDGCSGCVSVNLPHNLYTYVALEILYCEERRLLYGGKGWFACPPHTLVPGQNKIMLKPPDTFGITGRALTPGEYTVTVTMADMGQFQNGTGGNYTARALQQQYALPSHTGVVVDARAVEGRTFSRSTSDILPRITLHTASGVVTGVHDFDEITNGNVYDTVDVAPDIVQRSGGAAVPYPQVRFYARRFGTTNVPLVLRRQSAPTTRVEISVQDFDALPEIVDGWREVTLRFPDALVPTFTDTGLTSTWEWVADGLEINNQWQILVPYGESATSGPFDASGATYGGASAFTAVGASPLNSDADATLIFSQDPPAVTGFALEVAEQTLEAVSDECALDPACIPTALYYNHLTWDARDVNDLFDDRTVVSGGWDTADPSGQPWSVSGGSTSNYSVVDGAGRQQQTAASTLMFGLIETRAFNVEARARVRLSVLPTGSAATARVVARVEDTSNYYEGQISISTAGAVTLSITKRVGGTGSTISGLTTIDGTHAANDIWNIAFRCQADQLLAKAWKDGYPEPLAWQAVTQTLPGDAITGTQAGFASRAESGATGLPWNFDLLDFSATSLDVTAFELQRRDDVDEVWQTVMRSTGTAVNEFNDYEARVGVASQYRMRTINALEFYGAWTASGSTTLYTFDAGDEGWTGEGPTSVVFTTEQTHDGVGALAAIETLGSGFADMRFNDAAGVRDLSASGNAVTAWILIPEGARGSAWQARLEVQDTSFAWFSGPFYSLTPGVWTPLRYTPPDGLLANCRAIGFDVEATDVNGTQTVYVDTIGLTFDEITLPAPGVVGAGNDGNSVLVFTTNEVQAGTSNLAYVMVWTGDVEEEFTFPESSTVQLRELFRRDFPLAFRPLERGGERFTRDLIVQNAAVPTGLMRDGFRSLRDMAWEDVSYVCVRNELGDRWLSTVLVPSGKVQRNRRLYIARVEIIEVSDTPTQVDPAEA